MKQTWKIVIVVVLVIAVISTISIKRNLSQTDGTNTLFSSGQAIAEQIPSEFKVENLTGKGIPVLVDIGADTCIPCKLMAPILEELKEELKGTIQVQFLNLNEYPKFAEEFKINVMPTQIFYDAAGQECFRHEGFYAKEDILAKWTELGINIIEKSSNQE